MPRLQGWTGRSRGSALGHRFFFELIRCLGVRVAYGFLYCVVPFYAVGAVAPRRASYRFARLRLGYSRWRAAGYVFRNMYALGQILIDRWALRMPYKAEYAFAYSDDYTLLRRVLDAGHGVVCVGAHVGNWEIGAPFFGDYASRIVVGMYDGDYEAAKRELHRGEGEVAFRVLPLGDDGVGTMLAIHTALQAGDAVCLQGDRYMGAMKHSRHTFLGGEAQFPLGPFQVAAAEGVPMVVYFAIRTGYKCYRFHFRMVEPQGGSRAERVAYLQRAYIDELENVVRCHPEQWFNFYDFWDVG